MDNWDKFLDAFNEVVKARDEAHSQLDEIAFILSNWPEDKDTIRHIKENIYGKGECDSFIGAETESSSEERVG